MPFSESPGLAPPRPPFHPPSIELSSPKAIPYNAKKGETKIPEITLSPSPVMTLASIPDFEPPDTSDSDTGFKSLGAGLISKAEKQRRRYSAFDPSSPRDNAARQALRTQAPRPKSGIFFSDSPVRDQMLYYQDSLNSPTVPTFASQRHNHHKKIPSMASLNYTPLSPAVTGPPPISERASRTSSPVRARSPMRSKSPVRQPFNFQSQMMMHNNSSANSLTGHTRTSSNTGLKPAHRKGHRYKHSSVSMNLFQEPKSRADINIPVTLPFPKLGEIRGSLSHEQSTQVAWGLWHVLLSALLYLINRHTGLPNFDTLSHLVFYDSVSIMAMIIVNVMGNFDCWNTSSIKYPFGLGRIQVLAGFALAIWLSFVGFDLSNHCVEAYMAEFVVGEGHAHDTPSGGHSHHHHHAHPDMSGYDVVNGNRFVFSFMLLLTIFTTIVSAKLIRSDSSHKSLANIVSMSDLKVTKWDRQQLWARLSQKMNNPAHLLTLVLADLLLLTYNPFYPCAINEKIMAFTIAILIIVLGIKLTHKLGLILILSFPASAKQFDRLLHEVENDIKNLDAFKSSTNLSEIFITKFNYKLYVIGLRLKMIGGSDQDECLLRNDIVRLIKRHLSDYEERVSGHRAPSVSNDDSDDTGEWEDVAEAVDNDAFEITVDIDRL